MEEVVITYLWLSILLYIVFGGADFGAGIIELFTSKENRSKTRKTLYYAIGPIWEANHMWLIIAIVILFVGFPVIYAQLSTYLHIPLVIMLFGIIARGTAFIFRHYDAMKDDTHRIYNRVFISSSFVTPLFLGIIAGSAVSGSINPDANNFLDAYVFSWLNLFSIAVGFFTVSICGFLAAVYLIGEASNLEDTQRFTRKAKFMNAWAFLSGGLVFVAAEIERIPLSSWIFGHTLGIIAVAAASVSLLLMWLYIYRKNIWLPRVLAGFQVTMILLAISTVHYPDFVVFGNGNGLSLETHQAPSSVIYSLALALLLGSIFILPALFYLYYSFKNVDPNNDVH
jgi:cytochrome bd ubiquinol oxidase subunit II